MINNSVFSDIRNKLYNLGFGKFIDLTLKEFGEYCLVFCFFYNKMYEVRYYEENKRHLIENYLNMEKYGITPFSYIVEKDFVVYENEGVCRSLCLEDLSDENVVASLAAFYKKIHNIECDCVEGSCYFNKDNVLKVINHFNLKNNECLVCLYNNADNLELKMKRLKSSLLCGGFPLEDLGFCGHDGEIYLKNLDGIKRGNRCLDLNELFENLSLDKREKFLKIYGDVKLDEIVLSKIEKVLRDLLLASQKNVFSSGVDSSFRLIENRSFLLDIKCLVEWY